ncbi:MAG: hypothetical protein INQ03_16890 [Candidatus Heimdallarchaeota archaeon]|nr:hypothetical protein [Candidatus Heimdallarchaeota archaeon]
MSDEMEYYDPNGPGIFPDLDGDTKKGKSNLKLGLLVGIVSTLALELIIGIAMNASGNLVHRYLAYMLGIVIIFVMAIFTKSTFKMFLIGTPAVITISFALPFYQPSYFTGLMTPFLNLFPIIERMLQSAQTFGLTIDEGTQSIIDLILTYGIVLDFILALFVGTLASLGISGILKILRGKVGFLTLFTFGFTIAFFILGVIILPYVLVVFTGAAQFAMSFGMGGLALTEGMNLVGEPTSDAYFAEAKLWFMDAEAMLQGLDDLLLFTLLGQARPTLIPIIENGLLAMQAGVDLAEGVGPLLSGVTKISEGIMQSMSVIGGPASTLVTSSLSQSELETFNAGITQMEAGFVNITQSIEDIQDAITKITQINEEELNNAMQAEAGTDVSGEIALMNDAAILFNSTLDVLKVLIADGSGEVRAPFIHLIYGALALQDVTQAVGETTSFEGTEAIFGNIINNLTIVVDTFDDPVFTAYDELQLDDNSPVLEVRDQISGMFKFIRDTGKISIAVGEFGIAAAPVLTSLNSSISIFTDPQYDNFTVIPDSVYDEKIAELNDTLDDAILMNLKGNETQDLIDSMDARSENGTYGLMSDAAGEFNAIFAELDLATNGKNFYHIAAGFQNMMWTMKRLKGVQLNVQNIQHNMALLQDLTIDVGTINEARLIIDNMDGNLTQADEGLNRTRYRIGLTAMNFTAAGTTMPQLQSTGTALLSISYHMVDIQGHEGEIGADEITYIRGIAEIRAVTKVLKGYADDSDFVALATALSGGDMITITNALAYIELKFQEINYELGNVDIAA